MHKNLRYILFLGCLVTLNYQGGAQGPFPRTGQVFMTVPGDQTLQRFSVKAGYNTIYLDLEGNLPTVGLDAIGFRKTDNRLYGIGVADNHLYRIGTGAGVQDLGALALDADLYYLAGDVSPDGNYLYVVGSNSLGIDVHLARIDLTAAGYPVTKVPLNHTGRMTDIAFDPRTWQLYGFDATTSRVLTIQPGSGALAFFPAIDNGNRLYGLYFDAFGDLYGVGSTLYGIVDGFFTIDKNTGKARRLTTGPVSNGSDLASCPYSVEIRTELSATVQLPCTQMLYSTTVANGGDATLAGLALEHLFPPGLRIAGIQTNTLGGTVDTLSIPGSIRVNQFSLAPGAIQRLNLRLWVGDIPKGNYRDQARLNGLPDEYGQYCISDFMQAPGFEDSSILRVNRFDADSVRFDWLLCHGELLVLESQDYGANVQWFNGATTPTLEVQHGGIYGFYSGNTCEHIVVTNQVTSVSCPFTISLHYAVDPDSTFACSEILFRYVVINDSGEPRSSISITDTLPTGFRFKEIHKNTLKDGVLGATSPEVFCLKNARIDVGRDTLEWLVEIGDVVPGRYRNRAKLFGLPQLMGPIRWSDDPSTAGFDSTTLVIRGARSDTMHLDTIICPGRSITLDAQDLGEHFLWDDGSKLPAKEVADPGLYHVLIQDGCTPSLIIWEVLQGPEIRILPMDPVLIHQGDTVVLRPQILNEGQLLEFYWLDQAPGSLSCNDCSAPTAQPLHNVAYGLKVSNEYCWDSTGVRVEVDENARIYFPNAFSPNDDGENDVFMLESPDFGKILSMYIYDRWGNAVCRVSDLTFPGYAKIWDGWWKGRVCSPGMYVWQARIAFIDGRERIFSGELNLIR